MLQVPPGIELKYGRVSPTHISKKYAVIGGTVSTVTFTSLVAYAVPHGPVTAYEIVTVPALTPVTMPPETVAQVLLALHVPPAVASVSVMVAPATTVDGPVIGLTVVVLIVTVFVAAALPQPFVTV